MKRKEVAWIIIAILIFWFIIAFNKQLNTSILLLLVSIVIILSNILAKNLSAPFYNIKVEHSIWKMQQFGWYKGTHTKKPIPIGLIPFFLAFISNGFVQIPLLLQFNSKNLKNKRSIKKSIRTKTEINESDEAFTIAWGLYTLLLLALVGALIKIPELSFYAVYYGIWNLLPVGQLDGTKLFFGSMINWTILVIFYAIALILVL